MHFLPEIQPYSENFVRFFDTPSHAGPGDGECRMQTKTHEKVLKLAVLRRMKNS
jgi:hypothetical protein